MYRSNKIRLLRQLCEDAGRLSPHTQKLVEALGRCFPDHFDLEQCPPETEGNAAPALEQTKGTATPLA